ncbi:MAG: hypothetical protein FWC86_01625 [Coriobacteriia bacterium]|nr:hypothetical protein [Coriobacteriia bacterium]
MVAAILEVLYYKETGMAQTGEKSLYSSSIKIFTVVVLTLLIGFVALSSVSAYAAETDVENEAADIVPITEEIEADSDEPAQNTAPTSVAQFGTIQYKVIQVDEMWVGRVIVELADNEHLPATIEIAVPQHSAVFHFGEAGQEPFPAFGEVRTENGFDIYTAVMTHGRIATLEYTLPASPFEMTSEGPSVNVSYTPLHNAEELWLIAALPVDSAVVDPQFEFVASGPDGEPAFAYIVEDVLGGQEYTTSIVYIADAGERSTDSNPVVLAGLIVIMLAVAVVVFVLFRRNRSNYGDDE